MPSVEYLSCVRALPQRLHLRVPILGNAVGDDLLRDPLEVRLLSTAKLSPVITTARPSSRSLQAWSVSKRKDSAYRSGRSPDWLKMKNSDAPAVKREEEEDSDHRRSPRTKCWRPY